VRADLALNARLDRKIDVALLVLGRPRGDERDDDVLAAEGEFERVVVRQVRVDDADARPRGTGSQGMKAGGV
jgi:hypothetical protein